jgi:hypothetical protein
MTMARTTLRYGRLPHQYDAAAAQALVAMMPVSTMVTTAPAVMMTSVPAMVAMMPTMMTAHMAMARVAMARAHIG